MPRLHRTLPLITASGIALTLYATHTQLHPLKLDSVLPITKKIKPATTTFPPYTPIGWGSNRNLTLIPLQANQGKEHGQETPGLVKRPAPLLHLGRTPLRDLVIAENYAAALDANGDCWLWGKGYDPTGRIGKGLVFAISRSGKLYVFSPDSSLHSSSSSSSTSDSSSWLSYFTSSQTQDIPHVELEASGGLSWGEKWKQVAVGRHHVLALTTKGRLFSMPLSEKGNDFRQLGTREELVSDETPLATSLSRSSSPRPSKDITYRTHLDPIPSLSKIPITHIATASNTSYAITSTSRLLSWGANSLGQTGLGGSNTTPLVPVPIEIVLNKAYPAGTSTNVECLDVKAGGETAFFTVKRTHPGRRGEWVDLLACGSGLMGALGTGSYSSAQGVPGKVKVISGLQEYSEKEKTFKPLGIYQLSVSPSAGSGSGSGTSGMEGEGGGGMGGTHVFAVLDTLRGGEGKEYGRDVFAWGANVEYQLGMGKRTSAAIPTYIPTLGSKLDHNGGWHGNELDVASVDANRLQLHTSPSIPAYSPTGQLLRRRVKCEETIVAGCGSSVVYWKIVE
uniref:Uncharacterized protein n=1 Tax=Cryptococcus bacillisporus CA1280 TaxID=1296109 RepID=A0A0D0TMN9_CRYGA|nr:hypothetical protein I312_02461 [Cryptococcus bacillisporus CA1280]